MAAGTYGWLRHFNPFQGDDNDDDTGPGAAAPPLSLTPAGVAPAGVKPKGDPNLPPFLAGLPDSSDEPSFTNTGLYGVDEAMFSQRVGAEGSESAYSHVNDPYERESRGVSLGPRPTFEMPTVGEVLQALAGMPADSLGDLQGKLFKAGLYGRSTKLADVTLGQADELTYDAFTRLLMRTARRNQAVAGDETTWQDLLDETIHSNEENGIEPGPVVELTDPAALRAVAKETAQRLYGKAPSEGELTRFVGMFHAMQTSSQRTTSGSAVTPNAGAQAEQFLTGAHPGETGTYQAATTYYDAAVHALGLGGVAGGR